MKYIIFALLLFTAFTGRCSDQPDYSFNFNDDQLCLPAPQAEQKIQAAHALSLTRQRPLYQQFSAPEQPPSASTPSTTVANLPTTLTWSALPYMPASYSPCCALCCSVCAAALLHTQAAPVIASTPPPPPTQEATANLARSISPRARTPYERPPKPLKEKVVDFTKPPAESVDKAIYENECGGETTIYVSSKAAHKIQPWWKKPTKPKRAKRQAK